MKPNSTYTNRRQPASWSTTSATLDYAGGNHRLVAIGSNATATVQRDFATNANEQHSLSYNLALLNGGSATVKVQQQVGASYVDLAGTTQSHTASGTYTFNFTPSEADIRLVVNGNSRYALTQIFMDRNTIEEVIETYTLSAGGYRYGFQGQEKDDEVKDTGNSVNYTFRMHDPRLGRFFAADPLTDKYPFYSPYQFSGNQVISTFELEGLEPNDELNGVNLMTANPNGTYVAPNYASNNSEDPFSVYDWKLNINGGSRSWEMIGEHKFTELPEMIVESPKVEQPIVKTETAKMIDKAWNEGKYVKFLQYWGNSWDSNLKGERGFEL